MLRPIGINEVYNDDLNSCKYDNNGPTHALYYTAGFDQLEYDIYDSNGWIDSIKNDVPDYKDSDLQKNSYRLYYKPYS